MSAVVKQLSIVVIAVWFSVYNGRAIGCVLRDPLILACNGNNLEVYGEDDNGRKWQLMTIKFTPHPQSTAPIVTDWESCESGLITIPDLDSSVLCKDGFVKLDNNKCYQFNTQPETWYGAQEVCKSMGATLAHPMNPFDNEVIVMHLLDNFEDSPTGWFIGGSDETEEGQWIWDDINCPVVFADWHENQPDNMDGHEHCLHYTNEKKFKWNDIDCYSSFSFICQQ